MQELDKYHRIIAHSNVAGKSVSYISEKVATLKQYKDYEYGPDEVAKKVEQEKKSSRIKGNLALYKMQLRNTVRASAYPPLDSIV